MPKSKKDTDESKDPPLTSTPKDVPISEKGNSPDVKDNSDLVKKYGTVINDDSIRSAAAGKYQIGSAIYDSTISSKQLTSTVTRPAFTITIPDSQSTFLSQLSLSPYKVVDTIPRFLTVEVVEAESVGVTPLMLSNFTSEVPQITESINKWSNKQLTARIRLVDAVNGEKIDDINNPGPSGLSVTHIVNSRYNFQPMVDALAAQIMNVYRLTLITYHVVHRIPRKINPAQAVMPDAIGTSIVRGPLFEGDYPHPFFSVFGPTPEWWKTHLNTLHERHPLVISESNVVNVNHLKVSSTVTLCTDQYATAVANLTFNELATRQLSLAKLQDYIYANTTPGTTAYFKQSTDVLSLLYDPTEEEWMLFLMMVLINPVVKNYIFQSEREMWAATHQFDLLPLIQTITWYNDVTTNLGNNLKQEFQSKLSVGDTQTPTDLMVMETFSDMFDLQFDFGPSPTGFSAGIDILSNMLHFIYFPRLSNLKSHLLQRRIMQVLDTWMPHLMGPYVQRYGYVRRGREIYNPNSTTITDQEAQDRAIYSIFAQKDPQNNGINIRFAGLMDRIRDVCAPEVFIVNLDRKRNATYPYWNTNYQAYGSWDMLNYDGLVDAQNTALYRRTIEAISIVSDLLELATQQGQNNTTMQKSDRTLWQSIRNNLSHCARSISLPFEMTAAQMQRTMMNSYGFVYDGFDPVNNPFTPPKDVVLIPSANYPTGTGIPIKKITIGQYSPSIALRCLISLEGLFQRPIRVEDIANPTAPSNKPQIRRLVSHPNGLRQHQIAMSLRDNVAKSGIALQFIRWLASRDAANPLLQIAIQIYPSLRMCNWVPLIKQLASTVGADFADWFIGPYTMSGVMDGRELTMQLGLRDPATGLPMAQFPQNTIFGRNLPLITEATSNSVKIIADLLTHPESPINHSARGITVGRFLTDTLQPVLPDIDRRYVQFDENHFRFEQRDHDTGTALFLVLSAENDDDVAYSLPRDPEMPFVMLTMPSTTFLHPYQLQVAGAIKFGNLAVKITDFHLISRVVDVPSRTQDYSVDMSEADICQLISCEGGALSKIPFTNTAHATNFTSNAAIIPYYIQWISLHRPSDDDLISAAITNTSYPTPQHKQLHPSVTSYGYPGNGIALLDPVTRQSKLETRIPNLNNSYQAIAEEVITVTNNVLAKENVEYTVVDPLAQYYQE